MTIHHDKKAYGRLAKTSEELSDEKILSMIKELGGEKAEDKEENVPPSAKSAKGRKKT